MKIYPLLSLFLIISFFANAQRFQRLQVPVEINGTELSNPWAGGLNSPQFSTADLNNDAIPDLYVFDRSSNFHTTFINRGTAEQPDYKYAPDYARSFPKVLNYSLLRDYNGDGIMDLFAHSGDENTSGYKVYKGKFENDVLKFDRVKFPTIEFDLLSFPDPDTGEDFLIYTNKVDMPSVDDIDGDGDLDILTNQGDSHLYYFKNVALERGFTTDTLIYVLEDECWGKFYIDGSGTEFSLSGTPDDCAQGKPVPDKVTTPRHGGSTVTTLDLNNDGKKELLYGDATNPRIICAKNEGTASEAWMTEQDTEFPKYDTEIYIRDFAATFYLDADGDGLKDIIASPNLGINGPDYESAWLYKNTGTKEMPQFSLQQKNFLIDGMIDAGTGTHPTFADYNGDGLDDLIIGIDNRWQQNLTFFPTLTLYENIGTPDAPRFKLVDDDWLNFSQFRFTTYAFTPTFGDMDGDGDQDLVVGNRFGTLMYAENTAGAGNTFSFGTIQEDWQDIDVGQFAAPFITDLNNDGKMDLVVGERNGNINFFPNQGTRTRPDFHGDPDESPNNRYLGQIETAVPGEVVGTSTPLVAKFSNKTYLITGTHDGRVELYEVNPNNLSGGAFQLVDENWGRIQLGKTSHPTLADLDGDNRLDMVVGNLRGGLELYTTNLYADGVLPAEDVAFDFDIKIFPNPAEDILNVKFMKNYFGEKRYKILNAVGQSISTGVFENNQTEIDIAHLKSGVYFLKIDFEDAFFTKRFLKK